MDPNTVAIQSQLYSLQWRNMSAWRKIVVETILYSGILKLDGAGQIYYLDSEDDSEARDLNH